MPNSIVPAIGERITTQRALALSRHYGIDRVAARIAARPDDFKEWVFDGASILPDEEVAKLFHIPNLIEIALKHDLKYAYGEPGDTEDREKADDEFRQDLLDDGADRKVADAMYKSVRLGGSGIIKTSFSWGFARR